MDHVSATSRAVATVVVTCVVGVITANKIPNQRVTARDLSMLVTSLCVPALLFSHMAASFTPDMLSIQSAALLAFGLIASCIGGAVGFAVGRLTLRDPQLAFLTLIGCAFQNTVILPLGLISSLKVDWLTGQIYDRAVAYVFVYSVMTSILMWTVGQELIRHAGEKANGLSRPPPPPVKDECERIKRAVAAAVKPLWSGPFIATMFGVACGLAGIVRTEGAMRYPVNAVYSATSVIGEACIPTSLILLGVNLRNSAGNALGRWWKKDSKPSNSAPTTVRTEPDPPAAPAAPAPSKDDISGPELAVLAIAMSVTRLILVPASVISTFHFIARPLFPAVGDDPSMILVLFVESTAPTAIATSLLFTVHNFRPGAFAQSIFFQYISVVVTAAAWLTFTLWYIENTTNVLAAVPEAAGHQ